VLLKQRNNKKNSKAIILIQNLKKIAKGKGPDKFLVDELIESGESWAYLKNENGIKILVKENDMTDEAFRIVGHDIFHFLKEKVAEADIEGAKAKLLPFLEGLMLSSYLFDRFLTKKPSLKVKFNCIYCPEEFNSLHKEELINVTDAVFWARDMVNLPVSHLNAEQFSQQISELLSPLGVRVDILEKSKIEALKMGGLLSVNKGSIDPPTFTIAEYKPEGHKNKKPIILIGKGVVYDTGGLSLKPTPGSMDCMKSDMAGAAAVIGALCLAAKQKIKLHIVALIPATDNRPGMNAYTPGDVITMFNGTTVEVLNTDAEGRMILADALSYSEKYKPELVIDAATLTGAAVRAIGTHAAIVMGNAKDEVFDKLEKAGVQTHERVVRFPFWEEYKEDMKSKIADLKNIGGPNGGMISAGKFLETFVKAPYVHMDVAGPTWLDAKENYKGVSGTGYGVRLLYHFLKNY
jgi:leucyl aminopeptidase